MEKRIVFNITKEILEEIGLNPEFVLNNIRKANVKPECVKDHLHRSENHDFCSS